MSVVDAATLRRRVTVLALDADGTTHVRLWPGHHRGTDGFTAPARPPHPVDGQLRVTSLLPPWRSPVSAWQEGRPFLLRDGGQGVAHLALAPSAWADAAPRDGGEEAVGEADRQAVEAWRRRSGPVVGREPDLDLAPLCTLQLAPGTWAAAKVLRGDIRTVHLAVFANRWPERPPSVRPWELRTTRLSVGDATTTDKSDAVSVGHVPVTRAAFAAAAPMFAGMTTLAPAELAGYRHWKEHGGGTFTELMPIAEADGAGVRIENSFR